MEVVFFVAGFLVYDRCSAPGTGEKNRFDQWVGERLSWPAFSTSLQFRLGAGWRLHVHHWLYLATAAWFVEEACFRAACLGGMVQGVWRYEDWYRVVWK